jgi:hypothetical protein
MNCHASIRILQKQSARYLGVEPGVVQNYRDRLGLWKPTVKEANRALSIQSGKAKREKWDTGKAALRTLYIGPNSKPEQHMAVAWREEMLAIKKLERQCSWSKHPNAQLTAMDRYYKNHEQEKARSARKAKQRYWRMKGDPAYKAQRAIRNTTSRIKRQVKQPRKSNELLGASVVEAQKHLERQFLPGMTWQNHGTVWEIDHIYPISAADLSDENQMLAVSNIRNLRPLWKADNRSKAAKVLFSLNKACAGAFLVEIDKKISLAA